MQKNNNNVIIMLTRGLPQVKENMKDSLQKLNSVTASFVGGVLGQYVFSIQPQLFFPVDACSLDLGPLLRLLWR